MNRQTVKGYQKTYINDQIWISTFSGGFQRAKIYKPNTEDKWRAGLRVFIKSKIEESLASSYQNKTPSTKDHIKNLLSIKRKIDKNFKKFLVGGEMKFGVVQKLFNLYLKLQWCLGNCAEPPHCPFDSIIIKKLSMKSPPRWTKFNDRKIYMDLVERALEVSGNKSIAKWELETYQKDRLLSNLKKQ